MHTVFALLCFVVVIHWLIFPYPSSLLHWHCGNLTIAPVPAKQPWWIWINTSCKFIMNDCITTTKQSTTKPCAYFLGYTVCMVRCIRLSMRQLRLHSYGFSYSVDWDDWSMFVHGGMDHGCQHTTTELYFVFIINIATVLYLSRMGWLLN